MITLQRLAALSVSSVVFAACSGGGSSPATQLATNAASALTTHAPNAVLSITFPTNAVRIGNASGRAPKFLDPYGTPATFEVEVTANGVSYMAAIDQTVAVTSAGQTAQIPVFLAPSGSGPDTILVQEYNGHVYSTGGYLLTAQGTANVSVGEGTNVTPPPIQMQMVLQTINNIFAVQNLTTFSQVPSSAGNGFTGTPGGNYVCLSSVGTAPFYIVPVDANGTTTFTGGTPAGIGGVPLPQITSSSLAPATTATSNSGTSALVPTAFGGYTAYIDSASDGILVQATYNGTALIDPQAAFSAPYSAGQLVTQATSGSLIEYFSIKTGC